MTTAGRETVRRSTVQAASRGTWDAEYSHRSAIPSSHRDAPSTALVRLVERLDIDRTDTVVDVGCGNGRNAVFLANRAERVVGIDFSGEALALARERVRDATMTERVGLLQGDVRGGLPFRNDAVDVVVDSYVSCHFLSRASFERYVAEASRVLEPKGRLYWSALSKDDGYYRQLSDTHPDPDVVVDPLNGVPKRLYSAEEVADGIAEGLRTDHVTRVSFVDTVDDTDYRREILAAIYRVT